MNRFSTIKRFLKYHHCATLTDVVKYSSYLVNKVHAGSWRNPLSGVNTTLNEKHWFVETGTSTYLKESSSSLSSGIKFKDI